MSRRSGSVLVALMPVPLLVVADVAQRSLAGRPGDFGSVAAYRMTLDGISLARYGVLFAGTLLVWGWLRRREAGVPIRVLAVLSAPMTYSVLAFWQADVYFTTGEAAYYAVNPVWLAALGSQAAVAGLGEVLWRGVRRRPRPPGWWPLLAMVSGWSLLYATVLWDGGVHWFYVYQQGYRLLFT